MTDSLFSGQYEGHYSYGKGYSEDRQVIKVGFLAKIQVADGVLSGTADEYVTKVHMRQPAALNGFIEEGVIRFLKQYPFHYQVDKEGEIHVDPSRSHPVIHYSGLYDPSSGMFSGDWEMDVKLPEGESWTGRGSWEMRKV